MNALASAASEMAFTAPASGSSVPSAEVWLRPGAALAQGPRHAHMSPDGGRMASTSSIRYGVCAGGLWLVIARSVGIEAVPALAISTIPNAPRGVLGMANLRGNLVPVFDLAMVLDSAPRHAPAGPRMTLIFDKGEAAAGLAIDGLPRRLEGLVPLAQSPSLPRAVEHCITAALSSTDRVWLEFDHHKLFASFGQ